ncbi:DNA polymerase IF1 subunit beta (plasmid) [Calothrix sp. PCC 7716]|nr:DNA polymerase IF1 subunit beta [Calothrix sp. PCC 7716]
MKVQINQTILSGAIASAILAISSKPCTPITGCIIIEASTENKLTLKSTDASFSINQIIDADVIEAGTVAVLGKKLNDTINTLTGELTLSADEQHLTITYETGLCRLAINENLDEFPQIESSCDDIEPTSVFLLSSLKLQKAIASVLYSTANDQTKMLLTGANFSIAGNELYATATDGHRLARIKLSLDKNKDNEDYDKQFNFTVSAKILTSVLKVLQRAPENNDCVIHVFDKIVVMNMPGIKMVSSLLDGQFPAIERIIPNEFIYKFTIERKAFLATIKRVENLAHEKDKSVLIDFNANNCNAIVSTESSDYGEAYDSISIKPEAKTTGNINIGFNIDYLYQAVNSIDTDEIVINCNNGVGPVVISPIGGLIEQTALVMPLQIRRGNNTETPETPVETSSTQKPVEKEVSPKKSNKSLTKTISTKSKSTTARKSKVAA